MTYSSYAREEDGFRCDRCGYFYPFDRTDGTPPEQCENCLDGAPPVSAKLEAIVEESKAFWDAMGKPYPPHLQSAIDFLKKKLN